MSKRSDYILLTDMHEAIDSIQEYSAGLDYEAFLANRMARDAVAATQGINYTNFRICSAR